MQIKFYNPEIPGLAATQSRDFGIGKRSGIPGLKSLTVSVILVDSHLFAAMYFATNTTRNV